MHLQVTVAILIVLNFVCNAYEAQMNGFLTNADGSPTSDAQFLEKVDVAFTVVFTFELACNLFAHLFWEFVSNGWCMFDFIVVSIRYVRVSRSLLIHSRSLLMDRRSLWAPNTDSYLTYFSSLPAWLVGQKTSTLLKMLCLPSRVMRRIRCVRA